MNSSKSIYIYILSLRKLTTKLIKEFFFSTSFYNKLLDTKVPERFFFYPNPYLLSPLLNHKDLLIKISDEDVRNFWMKILKNKEKKSIHNFLWLNLIDRKNESKIIQNIIEEWINKYNNYKKEVWADNLISLRIISWISNAEIILDNNQKDFNLKFNKSLVRQINFIKKNLKNISDENKKIASISAIILSGLVFKEYYNNYKIGLKELKKIIENFFDKNGFPKNRNFENLIIFLQYFVLIKEWMKNGQEIVPEYLEDIIEKNLVCLNSLNNPLKKLPLFNGSTEKNLENFLQYLSKLNYSPKKNLKSVGQVQIIKNKKSTLYFDSGEPPIHKLSKDYQSGPLSFEYSNDNDKIITNCGYGRKISKKVQLLSKFTSAQSTLCLDNTSVVKFKKNSLINKAYGPTINNSFKIINLDRVEDKTNVTVSATHNAYLDKFGYLHKRTIRFFKKNNDLIGNDHLIKKNGNSNVEFSIRFHLYPGINPIKTISGKSILLQINKKKSWVFTSENQKINIEKSLFLGGNKALNNQCIVIYGETKDEDVNVEWKLKKAS
tara:strand:- start:24130 stop:25776 length:1647 start_codon:yes stop_codon:yes gene_type:complete